MTMDSNVVNFPGSSPKRRKPIALAAGTSRMSRVELDQEPEIPARDEVETITLRNRNLRDARKDAWGRPGRRRVTGELD